MLVALSSGLASLGLVVPFAWPAALLGLALFFRILFSLETSTWRLALSGLVFGSITGAAAILWFWCVLPLDFLGISSRFVQFAAVGISWAYVSFALGLPVAVFAALMRLFRGSPFFPSACAFLWPAAEIGRMWSFSLATWAPQSLLGPHFSPAAFGYALAEQPLLWQLAHPWGLDALNFSASLIAGLLAVIPDLARESRMRRPFAAQSLFLLALLACAGFADRCDANRLSTPLRVAALCENLPEVRNQASHAATTDLLARAAAVRPPVDVVVMPEEISLASVFLSKGQAEAFYRTHFGTRDVLIMNTRNDFFTGEERGPFREYKKLVYEGTTAGEIGRYAKHMLMPLGEYAPAAAKPVLSVLRDAELQSYLEEVSTCPAARQPLETVKFRGWRIGGLLCSDLLSPRLYRELAVRGKADVLVNLSNPFWFHGSRLLHWKTLQMAKVHAVQNRLPFILANNMAPSFALDSSGRVVAESAWGKRDVLVLELPFPSN